MRKQKDISKKYIAVADPQKGATSNTTFNKFERGDRLLLLIHTHKGLKVRQFYNHSKPNHNKKLLE